MKEIECPDCEGWGRETHNSPICERCGGTGLVNDNPSSAVSKAEGVERWALLARRQDLRTEITDLSERLSGLQEEVYAVEAKLKDILGAEGYRKWEQTGVCP